MHDVTTLNAQDLKGLSKSAVTELATALLAQRAAKDEDIARRDREIKFKDTKIERITFELARLKARKFGARTEAMNAQQRQMFEDTLTEDEADLQAQLQALQVHVPAVAPQTQSKASHAERSCPSTCAVSSTATNPRTPPAPHRSAANRWCALEKK